MKQAAPRWRLEHSQEYLENLRNIGAHYAAIIATAVERNLPNDAATPSRNRKLLQSDEQKRWELASATIASSTPSISRRAPCIY
jgi:hypothetical protein